MPHVEQLAAISLGKGSGLQQFAVTQLLETVVPISAHSSLNLHLQQSGTPLYSRYIMWPQQR